MSAPNSTNTSHSAAAALFAFHAKRASRALVKAALERLMLQLAHIAMTGRLR